MYHAIFITRPGDKDKYRRWSTIHSSLAAGREEGWMDGKMDDVRLCRLLPVPRPSLSIWYYIRQLRRKQFDLLRVGSFHAVWCRWMCQNVKQTICSIQACSVFTNTPAKYLWKTIVVFVGFLSSGHFWWSGMNFLWAPDTSRLSFSWSELGSRLDPITSEASGPADAPTPTRERPCELTASTRVASDFSGVPTKLNPTPYLHFM